MRVGIIDPYLDTLGGGEKYMLSIASCLSEENEVFVFWNSDNILDLAEKRFDIDLSKVKLAKNIFSGKTPFFKRLIDSKKYDLIIYLSDGSIPIVLSKLVLHFQFPVEWVSFNTFKDKLKLNRVTSVICNSKFTKGYVDKKLSKESFVLYPPVSSGSKSLIKKENVILTVGRYQNLGKEDSFKKQEFLIDVFKKMIDGGLKDWSFTVVTSFKPEDKKYIEEMKLKSKDYPIEIVENATWETLEELYGKTKIYWHASGFKEDLKLHPERAEHFGITTVEAMSFGVVPVVIACGGQLETVDKRSGFLWKNEKELVKNTLELIKNEDMLLTMSKYAVKRSSFFIGERFCRELKKIIHEI